MKSPKCQIGTYFGFSSIISFYILLNYFFQKNNRYNMNQYFLSCFHWNSFFGTYIYSIQSNLFMTEPFDLGDCCSWPQVHWLPWCRRSSKSFTRGVRSELKVIKLVTVIVDRKRSKPRIYLNYSYLPIFYLENISHCWTYCTRWPI